MSLRTDIHLAVDEVAPPAPHIEHQVRQAVKDFQHPAVAHVRPRLAPLRMPLSLVAAAVIVALMAGLVIAGRAWIQGNTPVTTPHVVINQADLKRLEDRQLTLPTVPAGTDCPTGPINAPPSYWLDAPPLMYGTEPFFSKSAYERYTTKWGTWVYVVYRYDAKVPGILLVRARDLRTGKPALYAPYPLQQVGAIPVGPLVTKDSVLYTDIEGRPELVIEDQLKAAPGSTLPLYTLLGLEKGSSGCIGFEVDGPNFTEKFVIAY